MVPPRRWSPRSGFPPENAPPPPVISHSVNIIIKGITLTSNLSFLPYFYQLRDISHVFPSIRFIIADIQLIFYKCLFLIFVFTFSTFYISYFIVIFNLALK